MTGRGASVMLILFLLFVPNVVLTQVPPTNKADTEVPSRPGVGELGVIVVIPPNFPDGPERGPQDGSSTEDEKCAEFLEKTGRVHPLCPD